MYLYRVFACIYNTHTYVTFLSFHAKQLSHFACFDFYFSALAFPLLFSLIYGSSDPHPISGSRYPFPLCPCTPQQFWFAAIRSNANIYTISINLCALLHIFNLQFLCQIERESYRRLRVALCVCFGCAQFMQISSASRGRVSGGDRGSFVSLWLLLA